jgi:hypothetical protein
MSRRSLILVAVAVLLFIAAVISLVVEKSAVSKLYDDLLNGKQPDDKVPDDKVPDDEGPGPGAESQTE